MRAVETLLLLPLWEKVAREARRMRGMSLRVVPADRTPHPALRATFSHKGRREEARVSLSPSFRGAPLGANPESNAQPVTWLDGFPDVQLHI
jgi:hypothetical protein